MSNRWIDPSQVIHDRIAGQKGERFHPIRPKPPPYGEKDEWMVELSGIEPLTSSLRTTRSPN